MSIFFFLGLNKFIFFTKIIIRIILAQKLFNLVIRSGEIDSSLKISPNTSSNLN